MAGPSWLAGCTVHTDSPSTAEEIGLPQPQPQPQQDTSDWIGVWRAPWRDDPSGAGCGGGSDTGNVVHVHEGGDIDWME
jgi:hypothetical protein